MARWSPKTEYPGSGDEHLSEEILTEYIDGQVQDADTRARVQKHLQACPHCQQELSDLQAVVSLLGTLPEPVPSRSFRLTREVAPVRLMRPDPWYVRFQPAMRRMTAVAAVLFVCVLAIDLVTTAPTQTDQITSDAAPAAGQVDSPEGAAAMRAQEAAPESDDAGISADEVPESDTAGDQDAAAVEESAPAPEADGQEESVTSYADDSASEPAAPGVGIDQASEVSSDDPSILRLLQFALALVVVWLLVMTVALPKLRSSERDTI